MTKLVSLGLLLLALPAQAGVVSADVPQGNFGMDYLIGLVWALLLGLSITIWPIAARNKRLLMHGWAGKCLVTLGFMLFYERHYELDAFSYFSYPLEFTEMPGVYFGQGNSVIFFLSWLHHQIFPVSYHMEKVTWAMAGLLAVFIFYRAAVVFLRQEAPRLYYALAFFPSIIFWSSTLGKDPIILLGIAIFVYGVVGWQQSSKMRHLFMIAAGALLAMLIRVWMAQILLLPLSVFALSRVQGIKRILFIAFLLAASYVSFSALKQKFRLETQEDLVATTQTMSHSWQVGGAGGGSGQYIEQEFTGINSMVLFLPIGAFTALFRPLPGDVRGPFGLLASLENVLLLFLFYQAVRRTKPRDFKEPLVLWALIFVLVWASAYGFTSYQNLGAAVRFRLQILPTFLTLILYLRRKRIIPIRTA